MNTLDNMGLLDDDPKPLYTPPHSGNRHTKKYLKQTALSQERRDFELNNEGRTEDYKSEPSENEL